MLKFEIYFKWRAIGPADELLRAVTTAHPTASAKYVHKFFDTLSFKGGTQLTSL